MRIRLPLYGKILGWFFLNLVVVAAVCVLLFDAQFHFNLDWLLMTGARERLEATRDLIVGELETTAPDEWGDVLARYSEAHHVRLALFDEEGGQLVGEPLELPDEVRGRILAWPSFGRPRRPADERAEPAETPASPSSGAAAAPRRGGPRLPLRALMRTSSPTRYWWMASARLDNTLAGGPLRVVLIFESRSISAGGLILDAKPWMALGLGVVLFSLLFWLPLVRGITRTIGRMKQATGQIAAGRFDVRLDQRRGDELGALAESINQMAERLDGMVSTQKRFLGDIAHELCAPLARLQMALGILEQRAGESQGTYVRAANEKAAQIAGLVSELMSFSKATFSASSAPLGPVELGAVVEAALRQEHLDAAAVNVSVPENLYVDGIHDLLVRAVANLLRNAQQHAEAAGPVRVEARREGETATLSVIDAGPGVPESELPKIFDAFYRVDPSRPRATGGTGLGLAIVKSCVDSCAGTVSARNVAGGGLEMRIQLHAASAPVEVGAPADAAAE